MLLRIAAFVLVSVSLAFGQAKVGTTGIDFLAMSPSVRSNGMGEVGVALTDNESFYFNPASLGFVDDHRVSIAAYPVSTSFAVDDLSSRSYSLVGHLFRGNQLDENPFAFSFALQQATLSAGPFIERTYDYPEGTGRTFDIKHQTRSLSVGASYLWAVQVGVGTTVRWIHESLGDFTSNGVSFDFGGMVRAPILGSVDQKVEPDDMHVTATAGIAFSQYGPDLKLVENSVPLPHDRRFGLAVELLYQDFSGIASIEDRSESILDISRIRLGFELGYHSAMWGRLGHISGEGIVEGSTTYGGSISVRGLLGLFSGQRYEEEPQDMFDYIDLRASFATSFETSQNPLSGADYFLLELAL